MRNRPYELGLIDGRLRHEPVRRFRLRHRQKAYARGYVDGCSHRWETASWWAGRVAA